MLQRQQCSLQKIIKQQDELNKLVGQTVKRVMVLEQQLEPIQEKKNLQVHHVKKRKRNVTKDLTVSLYGIFNLFRCVNL